MASSPASSSFHQTQSNLRPAYDHLIDEVADDDDDTATETSTIAEESAANEPLPVTTSNLSEAALRRRAFLLRLVALLAACWFSVGSHYSQYVLGPIKSRLLRELGANHTEFSLLLSAYSLNSSWTPLVGGLLASRLGTTFASILATGVIFLGQALLLLGDVLKNLRLMALGMFIFGLGVSPLAVVQETIIVRFFKSRGLGVSMAFGLVAGKLSSFVSARTTYPLTEHFGTRAPFYVATTLTATSVIVNISYILASRYLVDECGAAPEVPDINEEADRRRNAQHLTEAEALEKVAEKKKVRLRDVPRLGDVFWTYVGLNIFCGMIWHPFAHLAANIIENRFHLSEGAASAQASYLLLGSFFLYPICGFIVDNVKNKPIIIYLLLLSSGLTLSAYTWFAAPPSITQASWPGIALYAIGQGYAPLLLVVIVPRIVPIKYVSTALGVHKCLETSGTTIYQTVVGLILDAGKAKGSQQHAYQTVVNIFWLLNVFQLLSILAVWYLQVQKKKALTRASSSHQDPNSSSERDPLLPPITLEESEEHMNRSGTSSRRLSIGGMVSLSAIWSESSGETPERKRGRFFARMYTGVIVFTWCFFLGTAWFRLGKNKS